MLDELAGALEVGVGELPFPPPPPPPHAVRDAAVINAPKSTNVLFVVIQAPEIIIKIPVLILSV